MILKEEKTILMSISLQKTSNECFSFLLVTVEKSPTNGSLKYRLPVVFSPVVLRSVVLSWSKRKFVFIPLNDLVCEMARKGVALKSYR